MNDLSAETIQRLKTYSEALYELRLSSLGPKTDGDDVLAREWASCCVGEAICVLDLMFGLEMATAFVQSMLDSNVRFKGERYKRMRN